VIETQSKLTKADLFLVYVIETRRISVIANAFSLTFPFMKDPTVEHSKLAAEVVGIQPKPEEGIRKSAYLCMHAPESDV
jgi:hypothetical protein